MFYLIWFQSLKQSWAVPIAGPTINVEGRQWNRDRKDIILSGASSGFIVLIWSLCLWGSFSLFLSSHIHTHVWCYIPFLTSLFFFFFFNFLFYYLFIIFLFLAVLGLRFCVRAFSSCGEWGPLFITVRGPLTIAASLVVEQRLQTLRLSSCGSRAQLLRGMWDLPRPGLEPVSPALAGRFSSTAPPGKPLPAYS